MEELLGKNVVMTGRFSQRREVLKTHFERLGAKFQTSVRPDTDILLVGKQPGTKMLDKFDNLRGAGYDIALWEQEDIDHVWYRNYHAHMTQEDIKEDDKKFRAMIGESEEEEDEMVDDPKKNIRNGCRTFLIEFVVLFLVCCMFFYSMAHGSLLGAGIAIVIGGIASALGLTPIATEAAEEGGMSFGSILSSIATLGLFMPTSKHRQWRSWQFGRRHSKMK